MGPQPFTVHVPDQVLIDLRERLARTRWPDQAPDLPAWVSGTDLGYLQELTGYWREGFDWRAQERLLNRVSPFTVPVAGIDLHFIHEPGVGPQPLPLLLSHGWPGSVWEFHELIPRLTDPARLGGDPADAIADVFATLMARVLGYERFAAAGGDWGAYITARLAFAHAQLLRGIHLTLLPTRREPSPAPTPSPEDEDYQRQLKHSVREETGYSTLQATKPQTLAFGLTDSPAGLAAWIVEKCRAWSDCGGNLESRFSKDELLANITIYWSTGAIRSSFWPLYARPQGGAALSDLLRA